MKANRKFRDGEEAVSAVIGVILMVAITVAIAATVYVYVSGMMDVTGGTAPVAVIQIEDGAVTATAGVYAAAEEVFTFEHFSGDLITASEITIEYKGGIIAAWEPLTDAAGASAGGLYAVLPDIFQFGDSIALLAEGATTQDGAWFFRVRHNPSNSWIVTEKAATAI